MEKLPESYQKNMQELLGEEYKQYMESFSQSSYTAFRINTNKVSAERWKEINPFSTAEVAWTEKGFYYDAKKDIPAKHPYYFAGLYYIQEPSAMIPAMLLPVAPGDRVLDLCAAPGGKATELGAKLKGTGLLVANDISVSRTMALAKNLQMAGIGNAVVTAGSPEKLAEIFTGYFDKILIDAPCSGEGMFRREPRMIKDWLEKGPEYYSVVQKQILSQAYRMLKPGGGLVYSTCTFSVTEDEKVVQWLLKQYPDMEICPVERKEGFSEGRPDLVENGLPQLKHCVRIFPHRAMGEGHFAVLLRKKGQADRKSAAGKEEGLKAQIGEEAQPSKAAAWSEAAIRRECQKAFAGMPEGERFAAGKVRRKDKRPLPGKQDRGRGAFTGLDATAKKTMEDFLCRLPLAYGRLVLQGNTVSLLPDMEREISGLRIIYQGLLLCEWKHKLVFSHQLALTLKAGDFGQVLNLSAEDERTLRYLKGETISIGEGYSGNVLVCVDGFGLGWGQGNGKGTLKNKYYSGWRFQ